MPCWARRMAGTVTLASLLLLGGCGGGEKEPPKPAPAPTPKVETAAPIAKTETPVAAKPKAEASKPAPALGDASVKGKVMFQGSAPKMAPINMGADKVCKQQHEDPVMEETVVVNANGTLKNVLIYISDGLPDTEFAPPADPVTINQEGCQYHPHVFGIMAKQTLRILNSDPTLHNIHSLPNADKGNKGFNFGQPNKGDERKESFEFDEIVKFKCDVHGWMNAYAGVFSHPYFAVTGEDGSFEIKGLPAGKYTVSAWHELYGNPDAKTPTEELTQEVELGAKDAKEIDFTFGAK